LPHDDDVSSFVLGSVALASRLSRRLALHQGRLLWSVDSGDLLSSSGAHLVDAELAYSAANAFVRGRLSATFVGFLVLSVPYVDDLDPDAWTSKPCVFGPRCLQMSLAACLAGLDFF